MNYTDVAISMHNNNIVAIPVHKSKIAVSAEWSRLEYKTNSRLKTQTRFAYDHHGIAILTGKASDNLEAIDIDCYHMQTTKYGGDLALDIMKKIKGCPLLRMVIFCMIKTPRGGYHLIYRCEEVGPPQYLATINGERVISSKGEKGYIVTYPTPGYEALQIQDIPHITPAQRNMLFSILRAYNRP
jgi:hypothetical protein